MTGYADDDRTPSHRRLYRDPESGVIAGVLAGIADYLGVRPALLRIITVILAFPFFFPVVASYAILALLLERRPRRLAGDAREEQFWRRVRLEPGRTASDLAGRFESLERRVRRAEATVTSSQFRLRRAFRDLER